MRETILKCFRRQGKTSRGDYARLERLRKQANDHSRFHDIGHEIYIQSLIVMVPAWKKLAQAAKKIKKMENYYEHRGTPTKIRFVVRQSTR